MCVIGTYSILGNMKYKAPAPIANSGRPAADCGPQRHATKSSASPRLLKSNLALTPNKLAYLLPLLVF